MKRPIPTFTAEQALDIMRASQLGCEAFHKGIKSAPALDASLKPTIRKWSTPGFEHCDVIIAALRAWSEAWHRENATSQVIAL